MKVTPLNRKFGKYAVGEVFELKDKAAKIFIKLGKIQAAPDPVNTYQTRMLQSDAPQAWHGAEVVAVEAPYGYKADGTPRKRPGRPAASEE